MTKKYISDSDISFNLKIDGKRLHISFDPQYKGGSVYLAEAKEVQTAMEKHPDFGVLFRLSEDESVDLSEIDMSNSNSDEPKLDADGNPILSEQIEEVTTCAEAKEFLKERGVPVSKIQNKAAILEVAKSMNIEFINLK